MIFSPQDKVFMLAPICHSEDRGKQEVRVYSPLPRAGLLWALFVGAKQAVWGLWGQGASMNVKSSALQALETTESKLRTLRSQLAWCPGRRVSSVLLGHLLLAPIELAST